jgi:hypothetical protein
MADLLQVRIRCLSLEKAEALMDVALAATSLEEFASHLYSQTQSETETKEPT